jgi:hypothetical protein
MTILPAFSIRCSSVVKGGPGSYRISLRDERQVSPLTAPSKTMGQPCFEREDSELTIRVVATLPQLHNNVQQPRLALLLARGT